MIGHYSAATPSGHKVSIALEELGLPNALKVPDLPNDEQKSPAAWWTGQSLKGSRS